LSRKGPGRARKRGFWAGQTTRSSGAMMNLRRSRGFFASQILCRIVLANEVIFQSQLACHIVLKLDNDMEMYLEVLRTQYFATLKMLEDLINHCTDKIWEEKFNGTEFWREANHTLYWLELLTIRWSPFSHGISNNQKKNHLSRNSLIESGLKNI
jgi:hypothetical protein